MTASNGAVVASGASDEDATPRRVSSACSYESAGWACSATGYLWFSETRTGDERRYPCPRCNAALFVKIAQARAQHDGPQLKCICCGTSMAALALQCALKEVEVQQQFVCLPG